MRAAQKIEDKQLALRAYQDGHTQRWPKPTRLDIFASARECDDSCASSHAPSTTCSFNHQLTITPHFPTRTRRLLPPPPPNGWIFRAERYFNINGLRADERLRATMVCMEEETLAWFIWEQEQHPFQGWEEFKELLLLRFRPSQ